MKKKKVLALVLAAAMTAGVLSGCGNSDGETRGGSGESQQASASAESSAESSEEKSSEAESSDGERMTISVLGIDWGYGPLADSEMEQYWEEMFDVNLEIEWVNYKIGRAHV